MPRHRPVEQSEIRGSGSHPALVIELDETEHEIGVILERAPGDLRAMCLLPDESIDGASRSMEVRKNSEKWNDF